ncbi:MAG: crcB [Bacteroidota bacterium]|nr:crcB [Bacteroidota bacterium]
MVKYVYITVGGASGCLLRYLVILFISSKSTSSFPVGTFLVNILGCMLIGLLFGFFSVNGEVDDRMRFLLFVGFLGGFTTFSSFAFESMRLMSSGMTAMSLLYIVLSNVIGIILVFAGYFAGLKLR